MDRYCDENYAQLACILQDLRSVVQAVDAFMGTQRSPELIDQIAEATLFSNMKASKKVSDESVGSVMIEVRSPSECQCQYYAYILRIYIYTYLIHNNT